MNANQEGVGNHPSMSSKFDLNLVLELPPICSVVIIIIIIEQPIMYILICMFMEDLVNHRAGQTMTEDRSMSILINVHY